MVHCDRTTSFTFITVNPGKLIMPATNRPFSLTLGAVDGPAYALAFAGQATNWRDSLDELTDDLTIKTSIEKLVSDSDAVLAATHRELALVGGGSFSLDTAHSALSTDSVPGILAAQYGALLDLSEHGVDLREHPPVAVIGHSQGILASALFEGWKASDPQLMAQVFATARLIGAAATLAGRADKTLPQGEATPMLAIRDVRQADVEELIASLPGTTATISLINGPDRFVVSGRPQDLLKLEAAARTRAADEAQAIASKIRGGVPFSPIFDFLPVSTPFHSPLEESAYEQVLRWAEACGMDLELVRHLASAVLVQPVNWPSELARALGAGAQWFLDLGPGATLGRIISANLMGRGHGVIAAGSAAERDEFLRGGFEPTPAQNWGDFAPGLLELPTGEVVLDTKFSRLTGRSPVLLAGMTPTTVDPEIVAAAANAGHWAELAGGGQVTEEVFAENMAQLRSQLKPGVAAQFNAMFLDRYLWNLQFGGQSVVLKARAAGAPLDGVVISAGIPDVEEASALLAQFNDSGIPYVAFKPGTVAQIRQVLDIAKANPSTSLIIQVEDGHAGGHHSWEDLSHLLLTTYAEIRSHDNVVLCVGGGIGTPERAADYLSGDWSKEHGFPSMPVDGVLIGTAAMTAKEARTTDEVKQLLLETPGVSAHDDNSGWVGSQQTRGGVTSGLSHLRADIHEIDNAAAKCARLIAEVSGNDEAIAARRDEVIAALATTSKPYFGDVDQMTYSQWAHRFAELSYPWVDDTWIDRFLDLLHRAEARLNSAEHGTITTLFPDIDSVRDPEAALTALEGAYPSALTTDVAPTDAAWFVELCGKHPKPMPFVPVLDGDILRRWGQDNLWQSQDPRYRADEVRIIPGPVSVAGIDRVNEPIGDLLGRFETAATERIREHGAHPVPAAARISDAHNPVEFLRSAPHIMWSGNLIDNPAHLLPEESLTFTEQSDNPGVWDLRIDFDTYWDDVPGGDRNHAVRSLTIPLRLTDTAASGGVPVVDRETLPPNMYALLAATAGVGGETITGDSINELPRMQPSNISVFGEASWTFTVDRELAAHHRAVTAEALPSEYQPDAWVPDALLGLCWPAIYAALGSALIDDYPVIEGLLSAVHLDHTARLDVDPELLVADGPVQITVLAHTAEVLESSSGRVVVVKEKLMHGGEEIGQFSERFAIRGRIGSDTPPPAVANAAGRAEDAIDTPRSVLRKVQVKAPDNMTPFANVSGDFNPIHTSSNAAVVAGLSAPLVHGMWLSAVAQNLVQADGPDGEGWRITGWTYNMYGLVNLEDTVDLSVERIGRLQGGGQVLEVTCKIDGQVVSRATATTKAPRTAYVYPGQGIQRQGMGLNEIATSPAVRDVWERADATTKRDLGFSILTVVRDNPTEFTSGGQTWRHPEGILNLTQFTQVALAVVAFAQTAKLRESGALVDGAYFAGHSLGEYTALSSYGEVFPLETVLSIVFHRGSTMHHLVPRDAEGRSNYRMGALRPNQFGITDADVVAYVDSVSEDCGEFLQIVNFNLADQQYAVAGTITGLKALEEDANARAKAHGGKRAFMYVPGIDVPFHSRVLRGGVAEFRDKLMSLIPASIDKNRLVGKYIPNLVARPFELTREFAQAIVDEVPSEPIAELLQADNFERALGNPDELTRLLLVELLCWQFASPVRWIETQELLFSPESEGGLGVQRCVEIGLASSPTLAGLADKTLKLPTFAGSTSSAYNLERDEKIVTCTDVRVLFDEEEEEDTATQAAVSEPSAPAAEPAPTVQSASNPPVPVAAGGGERPTDIPFKASDAIKTLMAYTNKLRVDQIDPGDTTDTLTNGVSARRNQLLMDLSAELGLASIDGAADANVRELAASVDKLAHNYRPFGPVLTEAMRDRFRKVFGAAGAKPARIAERVKNTWALGDGWAHAVTAEMLLGTREGESVRGGSLATLPSPTTSAEVDAAIDQAVQAVAAAHGISVSMPQSGGSSGAVVDSAALDEFAASVVGPDGILADHARSLLEALGLDGPGLLPAGRPEEDEEATLAARLVEAVSAELGSAWVDQVQPAFDKEKAVLIDDRWASVREDLARLWLSETPIVRPSFVAAGTACSDMASWWKNKAQDAGRADLAEIYGDIASEALSSPDTALPYRDEIALVTGAAPKSIAGAVTARLLAGGATVIATASRVDASRLAFAKQLYRDHAAPGAALWLVPANLSSYRDVDALIDWISTEQTKVVGANTEVVKTALTPTLFFPFAAPRVAGSLGESGETFEAQARLLLWSVERGIAKLAEVGRNAPGAHRTHVILPGSPNRGVFGGDGAYGETKAAFDAITNRWKVEPLWAQTISIAHPRIGWVRGTGLMGGNDPLVAAAQEAGIQTFSTEDIADELLTLCTPQARQQAAESPLDADLTGGLGAGVDLRALKEAAEAAISESHDLSEDTLAQIPALPTPPAPSLPEYQANLWESGSAKPEDLVVVVGIGEVGTWGSGRTRHEAELGINPEGGVDLSPAAVLEMAWMMGLVRWQDSPVAGWYDSEDQIVAEEQIFDRFRDEVVARSGVRPFMDGDAAIDGADEDMGTLEETSVFLTSDVTFTVPDKKTAESFVIQDPRMTRITEIEGGEWQVTRLAGAEARMPRRAFLTRRVGGQLPEGFDPARWGIPASMLENMDRMAAWNLVTAVDAFLSAGFTPAELLSAVHPAEVAMTQGTGFGGMTSMRKLFVDRFLGEEYPQDILQETLPNVVAAHVMQSYIGGYGSMIHPVGACATAAVSVEEGIDKIACGKASFVVAGAIDDMAVESIVGFGSMNATADTETMLGRGIEERFFSRANDRRRGGFVEAQGGGTVLLARGDVALEMGLPVLGVIAFAQSFADGIHTSIPAPGMGALAAARGGEKSRLVHDLATLGVTPDDIAVVSKHDTSTNANDPNESELHTRLARAIGRTEGNPLFVISQKSLTGHAKGGACVFQIAGLTQLFADGIVPANAALDCVDEALADNPWLVWLRQPLPLGDIQPIKAGLATSLGFGHVSSLVALVHPGAFEAAIERSAGQERRKQWRERAEDRLREGARRLEAGMLGRATLFESPENRRFADGVDVHESEAAMLLDPNARVATSGVFER
ncbi:type I polyketide synthase [Scrofimicrobium canadense]|nr:type I polyketide synthase [Scrofimicrobium canadense]